MATFHENLVQSFHNFRDKYLKANGNFFKFSYDTTTQKYGFTINGTFHPFKTVQASKTVAAGTSAKTVTPDSGYDGVASVTVNPTPSQTKSTTAGTSAITVSPDSGKLLSSVTVSPTPSQSKTVSPSVNAVSVTPDSGKLLSSVTVNAMPLPAVATKWTDGTLNIIEGNLGSRGACADGVVRSVFEIPQGKYYGGRSARDLIGVTDDKIRALGWRMDLEYTTLWSNPNPQAEFGNQDVAIPNMLGYKLLRFDFWNETTNSTITSVSVPVDFFRTYCRDAENYPRIAAMINVSNGARIRAVSYVSDTVVRFSSGQLFYWSSFAPGTYANFVIVPVAIYGIK